MKYVSKDIEDTEKIADCVIQKIEGVYKDRVVVGLEGDLGSGKTALVKIIAEKMGVPDTVQSPTFVIRKDYITQHDTYKKIIHIDAYRITDVDLPSIGWADVVQERNVVVFVEWPEKINLKEEDIHISCNTDGKKWEYKF